MRKLLNISLVACLAISVTYAQETEGERDRIPSVKKAIGTVGVTEQKEVSAVDKFKQMFADGKVTGQIRTVYAGYNQKEDNSIDTYATAIGGQLKYELASLNGFNAAVAFATSQDMSFATGDRSDGKQNDEISSSAGNYTELSEAYLNYKYEDFNFRAGRQMIDTPLADSDDIRMISNTFEAYIASYEIENFSFMAGNLQKWQGTDAGLDDAWVDTGVDGTWFGGLTYSDVVEFNAWYYNVSEATNAFYTDVAMDYEINDDFSIHGGVQYLNESELKDSGIEADIYGAMVEFVAYDLGFNLAYNQSNKKTAKTSFSGFGGGSMYTSMDTMIIDEITQDRDATAVVAGLSYALGDFNLLYAYGDFIGDENSAGDKAHIVEQDIGFEYSFSDEFLVAAIYVLEEDRESSAKTDSDWERFQVMVNYNF